MVIPVILAVGATASAAGGVAAGINGGINIKEANDTMKNASLIQESAIKKFKEKDASATKVMDELGKQELKILSSFKYFSSLIEKIHNRPEFEINNQEEVKIPQYNADKLKEVSIGAGVLLGSIGGAAAGTAGGFAAAGATTAAISAFGTASTGTAIASLSGAAATNATLAALGGGSIAAGGGGIALGTALLGTATLGVGLLVGGIVFNVAGKTLANKAETAYSQAKETEKEVEKICHFLSKLEKTAKDFKLTLTYVEEKYNYYLDFLENLVNKERKTDWTKYSPVEKMRIQNLVLLVGLLYKMCNVQLVKKGADDTQNKVDEVTITRVRNEAEQILGKL